MTDTELNEQEETATAQRYPDYKDSGVEWLGEIPAHWEVKRLKFVATLKSGDAITNEIINQDGTYKVFGGNGLRGYTENYTHTGNYILIGRQGALCGNINYAEGRFWASEHAVVVSIRDKSDYTWLGETLKAMNLNQYSIAAAQPGLAIERIQQLFLPYPNLTEQTRIAAFLDRKTAQIDQAIAQKERLIELFNERLQVMIHRAVTRGLNPNVPMKESGIDWIGEIPAHWEVKFNRRLFRENSRKITNKDELPLSLSQVDGVTPSSSLKERSLSPAHRDNFKLCLPGDLLVNRFKGHLGVFFESPYRGIVTFHYGVFEPEPGISAKYFELLYHTELYKTIYAGASNGMTIGLQNLSNQNFYDVKSIVPPFHEQREISEYADQLTSKFLQVKQNVLDQIKRLQELKSTFINSAVTGKIKV